MAGVQFSVTVIFWLLWALISFYGARELAQLFPKSADMIGFLGAVIMIIPTMSKFAWDGLEQLQKSPIVPDDSNLVEGDYDPFTWGKVVLHVVGLTLIGLSFGMKYWISNTP